MKKLICALLVMLLLGCKTDESEVRKRALWLCEHDYMQTMSPLFLPADVSMKDYVVAEDAQLLEAEANELSTNPFAGLALGLVPAGKAIAEAEREFRTCSIKSVTIEGSTASVDVDLSAPRMDSTVAMAFVGELSALDTHEARVEAARAKFKEGEEYKESKTLKMRKEEGHWRIVYGIAGKEAFTKALEEALEHYKEGNWTKVRESLDALEKMPAKTDEFEEFTTLAQEKLAKLVGDSWEIDSETDSMTDARKVYLTLRSKPFQSSFGQEKSALLVLRCDGSSISLFASLDTTVRREGLSDSTQVKLRFGKGEPIALTVGVGTSRDSVFFEGDFLDRLSAHAGQELILEFYDYSKTRHLVTWQLAGADKAVERFEKECSQ